MKRTNDTDRTKPINSRIPRIRKPVIFALAALIRPMIVKITPGIIFSPKKMNEANITKE
jgi:hypothetical protein